MVSATNINRPIPDFSQIEQSPSKGLSLASKVAIVALSIILGTVCFGFLPAALSLLPVAKAIVAGMAGGLVTFAAGAFLIAKYSSSKQEQALIDDDVQYTPEPSPQKTPGKRNANPFTSPLEPVQRKIDFTPSKADLKIENHEKKIKEFKAVLDLDDPLPAIDKLFLQCSEDEFAAVIPHMTAENIHDYAVDYVNHKVDGLDIDAFCKGKTTERFLWATKYMSEVQLNEFLTITLNGLLYGQLTETKFNQLDHLAKHLDERSDKKSVGLLFCRLCEEIGTRYGNSQKLLDMWEDLIKRKAIEGNTPIKAIFKRYEAEKKRLENPK